MSRPLHRRFVRTGSACAGPIVLAAALAALPAGRAAAQATIYEFLGGFHGSQCGASVALANLDGDAYPEILVGAPDDDEAGQDAGAVFVFRGSDGAFLRKHAGLTAGNRFGTAVTALRDFDGDGLDDYAVGEPFGDFTGVDSGGVTIFHGATGLGWNAWVGDPGDHLGASLAYVGDAKSPSTGLLFPVIAMGAPYADRIAGVDCGAVIFRFAGSTSPPWPTNELQGIQAAEHYGSALDARAGKFIVGAPDFNGVPGTDVGRFEAYNVLSGLPASTPIVQLLWGVSGGSALDHLGAAVAIGRWSTGPGDTGSLSYLAGAPDAASPYVGAWKDAAGSAQKLVTLTGSGRFGASIVSGGSLSSGYFVAVGAPEAAVGGLATGRVHRYESGALTQVIDGAQAGERFGAALGGQLGFPDLGPGNDGWFAVGAPNADWQTVDDGRVDLRRHGVLAQQVSHVTSTGDQAGTSVAGLGDVNGDGVPDLLVGSPRADRNPDVFFPTEILDCGAGQVVSGATGQALRSHYGAAKGDRFGQAVAALGDIDLDGVTDYAIGATQADNATTTKGYVEVRSGASGALLFKLNGSVNGIGYASALGGGSDLNGDGRPDILVGAPNSANGTVYAYSGVNGFLLGGVSGATAGDRFGASVAGLGADLDGDGKDEYLVGAPGFDLLGQLDAGRAYVMKSVLTLSSVYIANGTAAGDEAGASVAAAGDVNKDGKADFLVGLPGYAFDAGRVRLFSGAGAFLTQLASVNGAVGNDRWGSSVAGLGDVDGDGWVDWAAGAPGISFGDDGSVRVVSGKDASILATFVGSQDAIFGTAVAAAGDVDQDGLADVAAGGPRASATVSLQGSVRVVSVVGTPPAWFDLGFALAGSAGNPSLVGSGPLTPGSAGSLVLSSARPSAPAFLFVSLANGAAPFKGGTLVPVPPILTVVLVTSATGDLPLAWTAWPSGLSGFDLYFQDAIQDPVAVKGAALSNALRADVP